VPEHQAATRRKHRRTSSFFSLTAQPARNGISGGIQVPLCASRSFATTEIVFRQGALGLATTSPYGAYVTDSAAAGSAMSTGFKVTNGTVSITPDGKSPRTVMEAAKAAGKHIGLVTTAAIHDATPAAFSVHAKSRSESQLIVDQYLMLEPDVLLGAAPIIFCLQPCPAESARIAKM
jgi:alkaline phosphatase